MKGNSQHGVENWRQRHWAGFKKWTGHFLVEEEVWRLLVVGGENHGTGEPWGKVQSCLCFAWCSFRKLGCSTRRFGLYTWPYRIQRSIERLRPFPTNFSPSRLHHHHAQNTKKECHLPIHGSEDPSSYIQSPKWLWLWRWRWLSLRSIRCTIQVVHPPPSNQTPTVLFISTHPRHRLLDTIRFFPRSSLASLVISLISALLMMPFRRLISASILAKSSPTPSARHS